MKKLYTEIEIQASKDTIWRVLTDFDQYSKWNPFIKSVAGTVEVGQVIEITLTPPDAKPMTFKPKVLTFQQKSELSWIGHVIIPGIFDGEHHFQLVDLGDGKVKFIQKETFSGILVPFMQSMLENNTKRGFIAMNEKLKTRCESSVE